MTARLLRCRRKHNRPMTLVIDDAQDIMAQKSEFLKKLQKFAKSAADDGNLRVVFVSSDFAIVAQMAKHSSWSRCAKPPLEVGEEDVDEETAVALLMSKRKWTTPEQLAAASESPMLLSITSSRTLLRLYPCLTFNSLLLPRVTAEYIVKNITGTRFAELLAVTDDYGTVAAAEKWEAELHANTEEVLKLHGIERGHALFAAMLGAPGQRLATKSQVTAAGVLPPKRESLIESNVLAAHADGSFSCAVRHVARAFAALRGKAAEPNHAAPIAALPVAPAQEATPLSESE